MIIALTMFITFLVTALVGYNYVTKGDGAKLLIRDTSSEQDIATQLEKYRSIIDEYYLKEVNEEDLKEGAIKGYIEGLGDPYTEYISKEEIEFDKLVETLHDDFKAVIKNAETNRDFEEDDKKYKEDLKMFYLKMMDID